MKNLFVLYFLAFILCSSVQVNSFRLGDFLFGSGKSSDEIKRSSEPPQKSNNNATILEYSELETDPTTLNSTIDEEYVDFWNASENIIAVENSSSGALGETSKRKNVPEETSTTKQSVKKQLIDVPPTPPTASGVTWKPRPAIKQDLSHSVKDIAVGSGELNVTLNTEEPEEVVLGTTKPTTSVEEKTIFQKSLEWVENTYTLSILIPVAAGILFATTCIITISLCGCIRRCCRRRRLRKKIMLPDSVKSLRASDRKRLLGDCSSDEEF